MSQKSQHCLNTMAQQSADDEFQISCGENVNRRARSVQLLGGASPPVAPGDAWLISCRQPGSPLLEALF